MTDMTTDQLRTMLFSTENGNNASALNIFSYAGGDKLLNARIGGNRARCDLA